MAHSRHCELTIISIQSIFPFTVPTFVGFSNSFSILSMIFQYYVCEEGENRTRKSEVCAPPSANFPIHFKLYVFVYVCHLFDIPAIFREYLPYIAQFNWFYSSKSGYDIQNSIHYLYSSQKYLRSIIESRPKN